MGCDECFRLLGAHERLRADLAVAKQRLQEAITLRLPPAKYQTLLKAATDALVEADLARTELEQHKRIHTQAN
jgi:hypothetical protein